MYLPHWIPKELKGLDYIKHSICKRLNIQSNSVRVRFLAEIFWSLCCLLIFNIRTLMGIFKLFFQQFFNYIVAVSFIGGGNRSIRRKPAT